MIGSIRVKADDLATRLEVQPTASVVEIMNKSSFAVFSVDSLGFFFFFYVKVVLVHV